MFAAGAAPLPTVRAWAEDVPVRLDFARDGDSIVAAVHLNIPSGYHAYAHEAGDAGRPTGGRADAAGLVSRRSHAARLL